MVSGGKYGQRQIAKMGIKISSSAITDGASTTLGDTGELVVDQTDGKLYYIDTSGQTQELS